ncbi:Flp family type IVb pilin [Anaerobacillus sp. MEB173]|uniref:Flp family type IVb pilin n=1 Tax=Anaerobacillus sp. MEB173 TaxID=3383345 RepID=UPI003F8EE4FD
MMNAVKRFVKEEEGQGMTEYGLILGVIAVGAIAAFVAFGDALKTKVEALKDSILN